MPEQFLELREGFPALNRVSDPGAMSRFRARTQSVLLDLLG